MQISIIPIVLALSLFACNEDYSINKSIAKIDEAEKSQVEMNLDAEASYSKTKMKLDSLHQRIEKEYQNDSVFMSQFFESKKMWEEYKKSQVLMKYPENDPTRNGSVFNTCYYSYLEKLTRQRMDVLKEWINGANEGDCCSGSVKILNSNQ